MPDIPMADTLPFIPGVTVDKGVAMNAPPSSFLEAVNQEITAAVKTLPEGSKGALVGVATTKGVNLAVVSKLNNHVNVEAWVGKSWGEPISGGSAVQIHW